MADSVSFKAYLKRDGQEVEVRRFAIDTGAAADFLYLRGKIQVMFPSMTTDTFVVYWQDQDEDYITISSDEELVLALSSGSPQPFKLYVHTQEANNSAGEGQRDNLHSGVVCDACEGEVRGFRYKCVTCADYDLCSRCERAGHHAEHFMLRMPHTPWSSRANLSHPKFFHNLMKRQHSDERENGGQESAGRGSFRRPACPAADMFDFTALLDFLNTMGVGGGTEPQATATAHTGASTSAQTTSAQTSSAQSTNAQTTNAQASRAQATSAQTTSAQTTNAQATSTQDNSPEAAMRARARAQAAFIRKSLGLQDAPADIPQPNSSSNSRQQNAAPSAIHYINGIGQVITALLDPFDIKRRKHILKKIIKQKKKNDKEMLKKWGRPLHPAALSHLALNGWKHTTAHGHHGHRHHHGPRHGQDHHGHGFGPRRCHGLGSRLGHDQDIFLVDPDDTPSSDDSFDYDGVDVTFDVRRKSSGQPIPMPTSGSSPSTSTAAPATASAPTPSNPTPVGTNAAPATTTTIYPELPTPPSQSPTTARRNSDDWTLLNRESPVRGETVAMDVDREAPRSQEYTETASAPSPNPQPVDAEKKRIDDCLEKLRAMGFDLGPDTQILRDLLTKENCDIASVLDILLSNARK